MPEPEKAQRALKAELLLAAQAQLGLDALTPGDGDLAFGLDFLVDGAQKHGLPYLSANLARLDDTLVFPATKVVEHGSLTIGLTGVMGSDLGVTGVKVLDPLPALKGAVAELRAQDVDLVVVLSHLGSRGDTDLAKQVPGVDIVFGGHDRKHMEAPTVVGQTAIFQAGSRGKHVGHATFHLVEGGTGWSDPEGRARALRQQSSLQRQVERYKEQQAAAEDDKSRERLSRVLGFAEKRLAELVIPEEGSGKAHRIESTKIPMGKALADEPAMRKLVDATLDAMGPEVTTDPHGKHDSTAAHGPKRDWAPWAGARQCRSCHEAQYDDWAKTGHAAAYAGLVKERRHMDLQCWSCHVTGAGQPGGPTGPKDVGPLRNVQCEACHGPGQSHASKPEQGTIIRTPTEAQCLACHTEEQTEGRFVLSEYLPKVDHRD